MNAETRRRLADALHPATGEQLREDADYHIEAARGGDDWVLAVRVDEAIRVHPKWTQRQYLNRRLLPIADLVMTPRRGVTEPNLFQNECEGVCAI